MPVELGDERLNKRYWKSVKAHMNHSQANAAGPVPPACAESSFAATQATWRFFNNERITPPELVKPIREFAKKQLVKPIREFAKKQLVETVEVETSGERFVLLVSDWCKLKIGGSYREERCCPLDS